MPCQYLLKKYAHELEVLEQSNALFITAHLSPDVVRLAHGEWRISMDEGWAEFHDGSLLRVHSEHGVGKGDYFRIERYSYQYLGPNKEALFRFENNRGKVHINDSGGNHYDPYALGLDLHNVNSLIVVRCCQHYLRGGLLPFEDPSQYATVIRRARSELQ